MAAPSSAAAGHIYATLLLSDSYLPGALVLAHSLRDAGTKRQLVVLVTLDSVSADTITQLKTVYDHVLPVPRIRNNNPSNLYLMNRADLHSAFTKINLWKQTQFSKIVYIDADVVAYRAPDELFSIPQAFSAAPDIGWPDIFNTGVMVLTPDMGDYYAMMAMAQRGISFDGADQGLLNMHFRNSFNRLSFTYNVTPSAHYQYIPAYRHFQSSINLVHFIGSNKPWFAGRGFNAGGQPFDEMVGRWWAVYDRHYRANETQQQTQSGPHLIQHYTKEEVQPAAPALQPSPLSRNPGPIDRAQHQQSTGDYSQPSSSSQSDYAFVFGHDGSGQSVAQAGDSATLFVHSVSFSEHHNSPGMHAKTLSGQENPEHREAPVERKEEERMPKQNPMNSWDAQRQPPPADSKPEAMNFPATHYEMSSDARPFIPPARYPSPPKNMWYEVPQKPPAAPAEAPKPIFPWEGHQPRPSRSFIGGESEKSSEPSSELPNSAVSAAQQAKVTGTSPAEAKSEPTTPVTPTIKITSSDSWGSYTRVNAWDELPEINRYVEGLHKHRRVRSQPSAGGLSPARSRSAGGNSRPRPGSFKLTDFPSEVERPSLPVTPAPITRESFWGTEDEDGQGTSAEKARDSADAGVGGAGGAAGKGRKSSLPMAEGVPAQSEWDPQAQLQKLARQQSEALLKRLGGSSATGDEAMRDIPTRPLPFGSEPERGVVHSPRPVRGAGPAIGLVKGLSNTSEGVRTPPRVSFKDEDIET